MNRLKLFLAFALFPIGTRFLLLDTDIKSESIILGYTADIFWALALSFFALILSFGRPLLIMPLFLLWGGAYALDLENVSAMGQLVHHSNTKYLLNTQFLANTLGSLSWSKVFATLAVFTFAIFLIFSSLRVKPVGIKASVKNKNIVLYGEIVTLIVGGLLLFSYTPAIENNTLNWHNRNFFAIHLDALAAELIPGLQEAGPGSSPGSKFGSETSPNSDYPVFAEDLAAERPTIGKAKNVLVIVVEGIPGAYIESVASYMGSSVNKMLWRDKPIMPELSSLAEEALLIPNFVSHRNQTIRGLYSLLCSDYPKLYSQTPKPLEILNIDKAAERCLPNILRSKGFSTHYFQAAQLQFMGKNMVMPYIGFDDVRGKESFDLPNDYYFHWGPDDKDFSNKSFEWLQAINKQEQPWFATLLTVGTHHPYALLDADVENPKFAAVEAADKAIGNLVRRLKASGIADDTLIVITSDESHGVPGHPFGNNWGLMMVLAPDIEPGKADDVFSTVDLTLSTLDYLNLLDDRPELTGRSLFRDYNSERTIVFSQWGTLAISQKKGLIISCSKQQQSFLQWLAGSNDCRRRESNNSEMFATQYHETESVDLQSHAQMHRLQNLMDNRLQGNQDGVKHYMVSENTKVDLARGKNTDLVSGQFLNFKKDTLVTVELDVSYNSTQSSIFSMYVEATDLNTKKTGKRMLPNVKMPSLYSGERTKLVFNFPVFADYQHVQSNLYGLSMSSNGTATIHSYKISTESIQKFESLGVRLVKGSVAGQLIPENSDQEINSRNNFSGQTATETIPLIKPSAGGDSNLRFVRKSDYTLGTKLSLSNQDTFLKHAGNGWWYIERWGSWSKANFGLDFFLGNSSIEKGDDLVLTVNARAFLAEHMDYHMVDVWANDEMVETWELGPKNAKQTAVISSDLLNEDILSLNFVIRDQLASPFLKDETSRDKRELGIGLVDFTLAIK